MDAHLFPGSLGHELGLFRGTIGDVTLNTRARLNWECWLDVTNGPDAKSFTSRLSLAQFNSHRILCELWNGPSSDREMLSSISGSFDEGVGYDVEAQHQAHFQKVAGGYSSGSAFHDAILHLFYWEFFCNPEADGTQQSLSILHSARVDAAIHMACARISRRCLSNLVSVSQRPEEPALNCTSSWKRISSTAGATIEPCRWLKDEPAEKSLPYYLWDQTLDSTIVTADLKETPQYIAISHTWGRWKIEGQTIILPGTPWPIPSNSRFNVANLPEIMRQIRRPYRYIWMDLVCIPQDGSDLSKTEISRQATIFREASEAVMWLSDIDQWARLPSVVEWFCVQFVINNHFYTDSSAIMKRNRQLTQELSGSMELSNFKLDVRNGAMPANGDWNPWFDSLWTLQEICIRPDMLIANKSWQLVALNKTPVAFDEIVALENTYRGAHGESSPVPEAARALQAFLSTTGLMNLISMPRIGILELGSHRYCMDRRAEAIMAVLDATDWFTGMGTDEEREKDLVLDQYPPAFINEIKEKLGSAVFFGSHTLQPYFTEVQNHRDTARGTVQPVGSLLPFGPWSPLRPSWTKFNHRRVRDYIVIPHESVDTWVLEGSTGCVRIPKAVVVSSGSQSYDRELRSTIWVPSIGGMDAQPLGQKVDLHNWVMTCQPSFENHAVCLYASSTWSSGILLKEIQKGVMVKVGIYQQLVKEYPIPEVKELSWTVL